MASTLETRDHFKDVSTGDLRQVQPFTHDQSRQNRLATIESVSSSSFGSSFGVGKSMWNSTSNIWRSTSKFMDGTSDDTQRETPTPSKSGSKSLLSSSESEAPPTRNKIPWGTTVTTKQPFASRPQEQIMSPLYPSHGEISGNIQRLGHSNGQRANTISPNHGAFLSFSNNSGPAINGPRHPLDMTAIAEHLPSTIDSQSISDPNYIAIRPGGTTDLTPKSRPSQASNGDLYASLYQHYGFSTNLNATLVDAPATESFLPAPTRIDHNVGPFSTAFGAKTEENRNRLQFDDDISSSQLQYQSHGQHSELRPPYQRHITTMRGHDTANERVNAPTSARSETFHSHGNRHFSGYSRASSFGDHTSASPTTSEYKRGFNSPFHSTSGTPSTGPESTRTASNSGISSRDSHGYGQSFERKLLDGGSYRDYPALQLNPLQNNFGYPHDHERDLYAGSVRMNPLANPYMGSTYLNMTGLPSAPRFQIRDLDHPLMVRSPLLEEFRMNNKNNKRYELRDIYNYIVEFSGDQHGSRFIQQKLETANSDEKEQIFTEIQANSLQLMTDVFGNYVIQKMFEHGNQSQKKALANQMKGHVLSLSTQMYGCRVVQKALEHVLIDQQASIVKELENHVLKCVKDQNGNHVIQKAIERVPAEHIQFIISAFTDQVQRLATHPYGCRVIQRMLEHCEEAARQSILQELHSCVPRLITDQFGNYVIQHVIENGDVKDKHSIVLVVLSQLLVYSKHKFASNVVEKSIEFAPEDQRSEILRRLTGQDENGDSPVLGLMRDQYGNYVIQKILGQLKGQEREALVNQIKSQLVQLKRFSYGKQIIAIEKLIFDDQPSNSLSTSSQSSTLPSTNASTVEGPVNSPYHHDVNKFPETAIALPLSTSSIRT